MRIVKLFGLPTIEGMDGDNCESKCSQFSHGRGHTRMEEIILAWKEPYSHPVATCEFLRSGSVVNVRAQGLEVMNVNPYTFCRKL
jgi:hypothetical protein